ncbi:chemotaxis protein histidine kinase CheA [Arthrobacter sp. B3I9]|uniref:mucin-associated surface protein n=1 Tax=Arthrobacter sp. B3I9 TaxID=3042270 RepID=UPI00278EDE38|nr:mucin-associated surface protein [Arthrobacter sp. B3I9]MDQ0851246.1 chemotaxis protein histidine kinase CheA [Arthrobacter sp. B3I9]
MSARTIMGAGGRAWHPAAGLLVTAVLAAALAGCSAPPPELGRDAAQQFQSKVLAVTEAAAVNDTAGSLKLLDELVVGLDDAAARGEVSFKRHQSIKTSIDAVRVDLMAQQAAAAEAAAEAARVAAEQEAAAQAAAKSAADAAAAQEAADQAAAAQAAAARAAAAAPPPAVVAPAPAPPPQNPAKGGKAKGKDKNG